MRPLTSTIRKVSATALVTAVSAALLTSVTKPSLGAAATQATYYVAPGGNDARPLRGPQPFGAAQFGLARPTRRLPRTAAWVISRSLLRL